MIVIFTFGYIKIKEVTIQDGLHNSSNNYNQIKKIFCVITVNPIQYIQSSIRAQCKQIVRSNSLSFACSRNHKQLWHNCYCFQINTVCPQNLQFKITFVICMHRLYLYLKTDLHYSVNMNNDK